MVIRMRKAALFLVISLVAAVISLGTEGQAGAAVFPSVVVRPAWYPPAPGFGSVLGKIAKDASDNIYVTDVENRKIVKFDAYGNHIASFDTSSQGRPYGLAVMKSGVMVVTFMYPQPKVRLYDPSGTLMGQQGDFTRTDLKFQSPIAVTLDAQENIYVLDSGSFEAPIVGVNDGTLGGDLKYYFVSGTSMMCVQVYDKFGYAKSTLGAAASALFPTNSFGSPSLLNPLAFGEPNQTPENGRFMSPEAITYDPINKWIIVGDSLNGRVQFFGAADYADPLKQFKYLFKIGDLLASDANAPYIPHMSNPAGVTIENPSSGMRLFVIDKVLKRVQVIDPNPALPALVGTSINEAAYPAMDLVYPRDILVHRGNLLIANEQGLNPANLLTISLDGAPWPPARLTLTFNQDAAMTPPVGDVHFPNLAQRLPDHKFTITGKVTPNAIVTWKNNEGDGVNKEFSGTCSVSVTGVELDDYTCVAQMSTIQTDQDIVIRATKDSNEVPLAIPHINYLPTGPLTYAGPVLTFNAIPAAEQYRKTSTITVSGTVNYKLAGNISTPGKELQVEIYNSANKLRYFATVDTSGLQDVKTWTATVTLVADVVNTLTPKAFVELSPRSSSAPIASQDVIVDTVVPVVNFGFYRDGSVVMDQVQNAAGTIVDENLDSVSLLINSGYPIAVNPNRLGTSTAYYFSSLALLSRNGNNTLQVVARDKAGNETLSLVYSVNLQPMLPNVTGRLTAAGTSDNLFYPNASVPLLFSGVVPATTTSVKFGTEDAILNGLSWSRSTIDYLRDSEKVVPITIDAIGDYGKISKLRSLYVHASAPSAEITKPFEDIAINNGNGYTFTVAVAPSNTNPTTQITLVTVELTDSNGVPVFAPQTFNNPGATVTTTAVDLLTAGVYTLKVTVSNGIAGEETVAIRNLLLDKTKPSVGIALDQSPNPTTIQGYIEPGATVSVTYDGVSHTVTQPDSLNQSIWSVSGVFSDLSKLTVTATDVAGNTNTRYWQPTPDADVDGDGSLRVYDAIVALRAYVSSAVDAETFKHADIAPLVNGVPAPDGLMTMADAQLVLLKVEGKPWPLQ